MEKHSDVSSERKSSVICVSSRFRRDSPADGAQICQSHDININSDISHQII